MTPPQSLASLPVHVGFMVDKLPLGQVFLRLLRLSSRSLWPRGLRLESAAARLLGLRVRIPPRHGCVSLVNFVCCHVEVSATGRSLVQRSHTECDVCVCDLETSKWGGLDPLGLWRREKKNLCSCN